MPLLNDIGEKLEDESIGTVGTNIFLGYMPDSPDICIGLFIYAGAPPDEVSEDVEYPGLQVRVRGAAAGFEDALEKAYDIFNALHGLTDTTLTATYYYRISANQSPAQMGVDEKDRPEFVINFSVMKEVE